MEEIQNESPEMVPILRPETFDAIRMIIYGNAGVGKTELLSTLLDDPRTNRPLWIDSESGLRSIRSKIRRIDSVKDLGKPEPGKIDVIFLERWGSLQKIYDFLFTKIYAEKRLQYNCVVIDSLTEVNAACVAAAINESPEMKIDRGVARMQDYLKVNQQMKDMIRAFRSLEGLHCFFTALPQFKAENPKDENSKVMIKPSLVGKLADEATALVDYVAYMKSSSSGSRKLQFQPDSLTFAKERSEKGKLINVIESANKDSYITMTMVLDAIEGKPGKDPKTKQNGNTR